VLIKYFSEDPEPDQGLMFDMGTFHYCRDIDRIMDWTKENQVESVTMQNLWWSGDDDTMCSVYGVCFE